VKKQERTHGSGRGKKNHYKMPRAFSIKRPAFQKRRRKLSHSLVPSKIGISLVSTPSSFPVSHKV
jgi:hypothetical protein